MLIIEIDNDMSHLRPYKAIGDCIIDLTKTTDEDRLKLRDVLLSNHQQYTEDSFSNIWDKPNRYLESYCRSYSGTWNITSLKANISLEDFLQHYTKGE